MFKYNRLLILTLALATFFSTITTPLKISVDSLTLAIGILVIVLLYLLKQFVFSNSNISNKILILIILFLSSFFVQLVVISSGGLYSPLLILSHLYALGLVFLFDIVISIWSLAFSVLSFSINLLVFNPQLITDPWTVIIYLISFIGVVPLYYFLFTRYKLKDDVATILSQQNQLIEGLQKSLLKSIPELVIVTDTRLNILSYNQASEQILALTPSEIIDHPFFDVFFLKDKNGELLNSGKIFLNEIVNQKTTKIISDLFLFLPNNASPKKISMQIRPVDNLKGVVDTIMIVLSSSQTNTHDSLDNPHNLKAALLQTDVYLEQLKNELAKRGLSDLKIQAELLGRAENNLLTIQEIEDHDFQVTPSPFDIANLFDHIIKSELIFANYFRLPVEIRFDDQTKASIQSTIPSGIDIPAHFLTSRFFTIISDKKWIESLIWRIIDIAIFIAKPDNNKILITLSSTPEKVTATITTVVVSLPPQQKDLLFVEYFGSLQKSTRLHFLSGLEGYIAKLITTSLNLNLSAEVSTNSVLIITLQFPKPKNTQILSQNYKYQNQDRL